MATFYMSHDITIDDDIWNQSREKFEKALKEELYKVADIQAASMMIEYDKRKLGALNELD